MRNIRLEDLGVGDICLLKSGCLCVVLPNENSSSGLSLYGKLVSTGKVGCKIHLIKYNYDKELTNYMDEYNIVAVYKANTDNNKFSHNKLMCYVYGVAEPLFNKDDYHWDWEVPKEMTIDEICEALGYKVKIVN